LTVFLNIAYCIRIESLDKVMISGFMVVLDEKCCDT